MSARQYKHPPIEEALCEFTFASESGGKQVDLTLPGRLQMHRSMKEYSGKARTQNVQKIAASDTAPNVSIESSIFRIQLPTQDGTRMVSVGANTLAITTLRPYDGWPNFKPRIEQALEAYVETTAPAPITRIGLRYINRIIVPDFNVRPASIFNAMPEGEKILEASLTNFLQRGEYVRQDGVKVIVTQATLQPATPKTAEFLVDIDTLWDKNPLADREQIIATVEKLHDIEGAAFEALITEEARRLFDAS